MNPRGLCVRGLIIYGDTPQAGLLTGSGGHGKNTSGLYLEDGLIFNMEEQGSNIQRPIRRGKGGIPLWKRILDLSLIVLLSPFILLFGGLVGLLIRLGSPGPVLFRQPRVGYQGREFVCLKFRTMRVDASSDTHHAHTRELIRSQSPMVKLDAHRDPRLVPFGSLVRVSGLDELPQIINVLRGEMSLVGPRPCIPYEAEAYEPWHRRRFDAPPGLTGLWQVSGKNRTTFDQMVKLDIQYSQRMSPWLDLKIILKTFPALWSQYGDTRAAKSQNASSAPDRGAADWKELGSKPAE